MSSAGRRPSADGRRLVVARPASGESREKILHIRCSVDEWEELERLCPAGVPLSTWARESLLAKKVR